MFIKGERAQRMEQVTEPGTKGVKVCWAISQEDGAKEFHMRLFEIEPRGYTPRHAHPWVHEVFIKSGEGILIGAEGEKSFKEGDIVFIAEDEEHQFRNTSQSKLLQFICCIPEKGRCVYQDKM